MTILYVIALCAVLAAGAVVVLDRWKLRRTFRRMDAMLEEAIRGDFTESSFNETRLSALETKLSHYLSASAVSARNLQAEKDAIKTLIGDISHQTKTPVANLLLYAQLLSEQELPAESRACAAALEAQAEKLRFLIESLVKTSRLETGILALHPKAAPLAPVLEGALDQVRPRAEAKGVALESVPTGESALFDPKWTAEAVYNLLDNAVKYTPPGGRVALSVTAYEFFVRVDVDDTGPGIPEEEQAKVFQRFYRSPAVSETEGVGIGLYLTRQIAAGQGGLCQGDLRAGERGHVFPVPAPKVAGPTVRRPPTHPFAWGATTRRAKGVGGELEPPVLRFAPDSPLHKGAEPLRRGRGKPLRPSVRTGAPPLRRGGKTLRRDGRTARVAPTRNAAATLCAGAALTAARREQRRRNRAHVRRPPTHVGGGVPDAPPGVP